MRHSARLLGTMLVLYALLLCTLPFADCWAQVREAAVDELIKQLGSSDVNERRDAAYELVRRRESSDAVVRAYAEALSDNDNQVRFQSLLGLARAGGNAAPAIPQLIDCLDDRDDQVRFRTADALGKIGNAAVQPLCSMWDRSSSSVRVEIARSLSIMGPQAGDVGDFLSHSLNDISADVRRLVAEAIVAVAPDDEVALLRLAEHEDGDVRKIGVVALAALASPDEKIGRRLQLAAADEDEKVREIAIIALAKSQLPNEQKMAFIEAGLLDDSGSVRSAAIAAIRKAELDGEPFATRLADRLGKVSPAVGNTLVQALAELGPSSKVALPKLLEVSSDGSLDSDFLAQTIAGFGPDVVTGLLSALENRPELESLVASSLAIIGKPSVKALIGGMASPNQTIRKSSTRALGAIRPTQRDWLAVIVDATGDVAAEVREVAVAALVDARDEAQFARPQILAATEDSDAAVRSAAFPGLAVFDFSEDVLQAAFRRGLGDDAATVRGSCLAAIADIEGAAGRYLDQVLPLVSDPTKDVRQVAVDTLAEVDLTACSDQQRAGLVSAIVTALRDDTQTVRTQATTTATRLGLSDSKVLEALASNLADDLELLQATLIALKQFGLKAESLAPAVSQLMDHSSEAIRVAAVQTYAAIQPDRQVLTGRLTEALADSQWTVRQAAGESLGALGPDAQAAIPALFRLLSSEEDSDFARGAIREIDAAPLEALPLLLESLNSEDRRTSYYAIFLLGKIGPPAAEALPKLEARLQESGEGDRSDYRRRYLVQAIASIKGENVEADN